MWFPTLIKLCKHYGSDGAAFSDASQEAVLVKLWVLSQLQPPEAAHARLSINLQLDILCDSTQQANQEKVTDTMTDTKHSVFEGN